MFHVRNLQSPYGIPCGSYFCSNRLLFAFKLTSPLCTVLPNLCYMSIFDTSKVIPAVIPSTPTYKSRNLWVPHQYCHLLRKQVQTPGQTRSLKAKANHLLKKLLHIKHHTGAWVHWHCQSCSLEIPSHGDIWELYSHNSRNNGHIIFINPCASCPGCQVAFQQYCNTVGDHYYPNTVGQHSAMYPETTRCPPIPLDGLLVQVFLFSWHIVGTHDSDFQSRSNSSREDTPKCVETPLVSCGDHLGHIQAERGLWE